MSKVLKNIDDLSEKLDAELSLQANEEMEKRANSTAQALAGMVDAQSRFEANEVAKQKLEADIDMRTKELNARYAELELNRAKLQNDLELKSKEIDMRAKEVDARLAEVNATIQMAQLKSSTDIESAKAEAKATKFASFMQMLGAVVPAVITGAVGFGSILAGCFALREAYDASDKDKVIDRQKLDAAKAAQNSFFRVR